MKNRAAEPSRRDVLATLAFAGLTVAGCEQTGMFRQHYDALRQSMSRRANLLTREEVAKFEAASISLKIGRLTPRLVLLSKIEGRDLIWRASRTVIVATRGGRLIATGGLRRNLVRTDFITPDPVDGRLLHADGATCLRLLDLSDDYGTGIDATSRFEISGNETLDIIGSRIATLRVSERVYVERLRWRHRNTYWADASTGAIWKSRQYFHPDYSALTVTALRPALPV